MGRVQGKKVNNNIDELLEGLGVFDPASRAAIRESILAEMSVTLPSYIGNGGRVHTKEQCKATRKRGAPKGCVLHRPTLHKLTGSPQVLRRDTLIEDQCPHGVGHPNPDSAAFLNWRDGTTTHLIHQCDGCCGPLTQGMRWDEEE